MRLSILMLIPVVLLTAMCSMYAADPASPTLDPEAVDFFEKKIRPVLIEQCYECHSEQAKLDGKLKGGLLLDSRHRFEPPADYQAATHL